MKECECESPFALLRLRILSQLRILIYNYEFWWCFRRWWTSCRALSLSTEETGATKKYMRKITQQQHNSNNQKATICYCYSLDNNNQLRSGQRVRERVDAKFGFQFQLIFFFFLFRSRNPRNATRQGNKKQTYILLEVPKWTKRKNSKGGRIKLELAGSALPREQAARM